MARVGRQLLLWLFMGLVLRGAAAQTATSEQVPIQRCDVLPVVLVRIDGVDMHFVLDTAATTILNLESFSQGRSTKIQVSSWSGTAATSAREVFLPELALGSHRLKDLKLPAVDLSPIGKACGGRIDGILGIDLLDKMGATIDLPKRVAYLGAAGHEMQERVAAHDASMQHCLVAFNEAHEDELVQCFDPQIVLYTPWGEFRGRDQVAGYLKKRFFSLSPHPKFEFVPRDQRMVGDALWQGYDYSIESPAVHIHGRGMAVCRENNGSWQVLSMHNSITTKEE